MGIMPGARPDQSYDPPAPAVASGGRAGILRATKVIIIGSSGQILLYNPSAAAGDLVASGAALHSTDSYGNDVESGWASYLGADNARVAALSGGQINLFSLNASSTGGPATILYNVSITAGTRPSMVLEGPTASTGTVNLMFYGESSDTTKAAVAVFSTLVGAAPVTTALVEIQGDTATNSLFLKQEATPTAPSGYNAIYADVFGDIHLVGITAIDGSGFLQMSDISAPSSNSATTRTFSLAPGHLSYVDGATGSGVTWDTGRLTTLIPLNNAISNAGVTLATFTVSATAYKFRAVILNANNAANAADNMTLKFTLASATVSTFGLYQRVTDSTGIFATSIPAAFTTAFNTSNVNVGHQMAEIEGQVTFSVAGTFSLVATANTANNTTVFSSYIELVPVVA